MTGQLHELFADVQVRFRDVVSEAEPLNWGSYGLAFANEHSVIKFVRRCPKEHNTESSVRRQFEREISSLKFFENMNLDGVEIPVLQGDVEYLLDDSRFIAHYKMSRIQGGTHPVDPLCESDVPAFQKKYSEAGRLMARFHHSVAGLEWDDALFDRPWDAISIPMVYGLDDDTNRRLERANDYLQENFRAGNIHGDFHLDNIIERDGQAVGLLDFSLTGLGKNGARDFWWTPARFLDSMIEGYQQESGRSIRPDAIAACLSMHAHNLAICDPVHGSLDVSREQIPLLLDQMDAALG